MFKYFYHIVVWKSIGTFTVITFFIAGEYDDAIKILKKAKDDTSLETEIDGASRKRKPPKRLDLLGL